MPFSGTRIQFSDDSGGASPYTLSYNPSEVDYQDTKDVIYQEIIDGETARQESYFDNRPRKLIWRGFRTNDTVFSAMLTTLVSYENKIKYVNFQTIDVRKHVVTSWNKFRVASVDCILAPGGIMKWQEITMVLLPSS